MNGNPDGVAWLDELDHPLKAVILTVRAATLEADERVAETIKWKSPTFMYKGNIASIDPKARKHVTVLFHRGAEIPGNYPQLEGGGKLARYIRFPDLDSVEQGRDDPSAIVRAWCDSRT